ncbi:MAG TPA: hypothetical protein PLM53_21035 [Spirochaetota bacterium]|nr:hypothetical protein [Spirochaetota bacterium]
MKTALEQRINRYQSAIEAERRSKRFLYEAFDKHPAMLMWTQRADGSWGLTEGFSNRCVVCREIDGELEEFRFILIPHRDKSSPYRFPIKSLFEQIEQDNDIRYIRLSWYFVNSIDGPAGQLSMHRKRVGSNHGNIVLIDEIPEENSEGLIRLWTQIHKEHSADLDDFQQSIWDLDSSLFISRRKI